MLIRLLVGCSLCFAQDVSVGRPATDAFRKPWYSHLAGPCWCRQSITKSNRLPPSLRLAQYICVGCWSIHLDGLRKSLSHMNAPRPRHGTHGHKGRAAARALLDATKTASEPFMDELLCDLRTYRDRLSRARFVPLPQLVVSGAAWSSTKCTLPLQARWLKPGEYMAYITLQRTDISIQILRNADDGALPCHRIIQYTCVCGPRCVNCIIFCYELAVLTAIRRPSSMTVSVATSELNGGQVRTGLACLRHTHEGIRHGTSSRASVRLGMCECGETWRWCLEVEGSTTSRCT